jgi:hypothetical protein
LELAGVKVLALVEAFGNLRDSCSAASFYSGISVAPTVLVFISSITEIFLCLPVKSNSPLFQTLKLLASSLAHKLERLVGVTGR